MADERGAVALLRDEADFDQAAEVEGERGAGDGGKVFLTGALVRAAENPIFQLRIVRN